MRWRVKPDDGWRNRYAFWPIKIGDKWIWLECFQRRFCCTYYEVRAILQAKEPTDESDPKP